MELITSNDYSDLHRCFLQHMMNFGCVPYSETTKIIEKYAKSLEVQPKPAADLIREINAKICQQRFCIEMFTCEVTGEKTCVFINMSIDTISKSMYQPPEEVELFEKVLAEVMMSNSKSINAISCLSLTSSMKKQISKDTVQKLLNKWSDQGYFVKKNEILYLGARIISEYRQFLYTQFPNRITTCNLCSDYVYFGKICGSCYKVFHCHCISKFLARNKTCQVCKTPWTEVSERHYSDSQESEETEGTDGTEDEVISQLEASNPPRRCRRTK